MKKLFSIAVVAIFATTLVATSCKKKDDNPVGNYTCTCNITPTGGTATTVDLPINNQAKNTAKSACDQAQATYATSGSATCTLH